MQIATRKYRFIMKWYKFIGEGSKFPSITNWDSASLHTERLLLRVKREGHKYPEILIAKLSIDNEGIVIRCSDEHGDSDTIIVKDNTNDYDFLKSMRWAKIKVPNV